VRRAAVGRSSTGPTVQPRFARVAAAIGNPTRALMLARLLDGRHYTAKELAGHGGVAAATASQHLKLLVGERLARVRTQGRHRYFTLADGNVAQALETLLRVADAALPETSRWQAPAMRSLRHARSCYGHLAGELGVRLCQSFVQRGWVRATEGDGHDYPLTSAGVAELKRLGLMTDADGASPRKRPLYGCVDWSERKDHFAGPLAVAMLDAFIERGWLRRRADSRVLDVTKIGQIKLLASFLEKSSD
jgi:DNA-binding transcriptional ArsR family regulator